jgi:hypothetical protein
MHRIIQKPEDGALRFKQAWRMARPDNKCRRVARAGELQDACLAVETLSNVKGDRDSVVTVWLLDPARKTGSAIFESGFHLRPAVGVSGAASRRAALLKVDDAVEQVILRVVVASWPR